MKGRPVCEYCGTILPEEAVKCTICGAPVTPKVELLVVENTDRICLHRNMVADPATQTYHCPDCGHATTTEELAARRLP